MNNHKSWSESTEGAKARLRKVQSTDVDTNSKTSNTRYTSRRDEDFVRESTSRESTSRSERKSESNRRPDSQKKRRGDKPLDPLEVDFLYSRPPEYEPTERPEDIIPDLPENAEAREFLRKAPTTGLWLPLGKEVKVMKCWRCGAYGHRRDDRDCPLFLSGTQQNESFLKRHEDPMTEAWS